MSSAHEGWTCFDRNTGNAFDFTDDPHIAGQWWIEMKDEALSPDEASFIIIPPIDCEGDCCRHNECRFGFKGGPSCGNPDDL